MSLPCAATFVKVAGSTAGPAAVVSSAAVGDSSGSSRTIVGLVIGKDELSKDDEKAVQEALGGVDDSTSLYVERGFQADDETLIAQLILIGLGGVLMLGGTLTATFLALSDARPDLATLAAVGASPRTRRGVAAAYAVVVGFVGAVLGAAVGFIPGIAVTYPLTSQNYGDASSRAAATARDRGHRAVPRHPLADDHRPGRRPAAADRGGRRAVRPVAAPAGGAARLRSAVRRRRCRGLA